MSVLETIASRAPGHDFSLQSLESGKWILPSSGRQTYKITITRCFVRIKKDSACIWSIFCKRTIHTLTPFVLLGIIITPGSNYINSVILSIKLCWWLDEINFTSLTIQILHSIGIFIVMQSVFSHICVPFRETYHLVLGELYMFKQTWSLDVL